MLSIRATDLFQAVKKIKRTAPAPLPILNHALLHVEPGKVTVSTVELANDGFKALSESAEAITGESWDTCVPMLVVVKERSGSKHKYYPFYDWLRVMAEYKEQINLRFEPAIQTLFISGEDSKTKFLCIDAQEFPPVPEALND
jgi:hypothetical protein